MIRERIVEEFRRNGYDLVTIEEAAELAKQSQVTIRRMIAKGALKAIKLASGARRIPKFELERYLSGVPTVEQ